VCHKYTETHYGLQVTPGIKLPDVIEMAYDAMNCGRMSDSWNDVTRDIQFLSAAVISRMVTEYVLNVFSATMVAIKGFGIENIYQ
jgi:hypothetical protein